MLQISNSNFNITIYLSEDITFIIKSYLWGNTNDWYNIFKKSLIEYNNIYNEHNIIYKLNICRWQRRLNIQSDIEDNFYCPVCGEKTLFFAFIYNPKAIHECMCIT